MSVKWTQPVMNGDNSSPAVDASGVDGANGCGQTYSFTVDGIRVGIWSPLAHNAKHAS